MCAASPGFILGPARQGGFMRSAVATLEHIECGRVSQGQVAQATRFIICGALIRNRCGQKENCSRRESRQGRDR